MRGRHDDVKLRHRLRHQRDVITVDHDAAGGSYTLIGQTHFRPMELRFHEITLDEGQRIAFQRDGEIHECSNSGVAVLGSWSLSGLRSGSSGLTDKNLHNNLQ